MNEGDYEFDTLAGFILNELERIPKIGEKIHWREVTFEIVDMDHQRIDKVLATFSDAAKKARSINLPSIQKAHVHPGY